MKGEIPFPFAAEEVRDIRSEIDAVQAGTYSPEERYSSVALEQMYDRTYQFVTRARHQFKTSEEEAFSKEVISYLEGLKPEANALSAIILSQIWNDPEFVRARQEIATATDTAFARLKETKNQFDQACMLWFARQQDPSAPSHAIALRHVQISNLKGLVVPGINSIALITGGMGTAQDAAFHLARIVIQKRDGLKQEGIALTREQTLEMIRRAYRNIGFMLARMDLNDANLLTKVLWAPGNEGMFELREVEGSYVLFLDPNKVPELFKKRFGETTTCPAMYPVGDSPAVVPEFFKFAMGILEISPELT